jgi:hypothetical protein
MSSFPAPVDEVTQVFTQGILSLDVASGYRKTVEAAAQVSGLGCLNNQSKLQLGEILLGSEYRIHLMP